MAKRASIAVLLIGAAGLFLFTRPGQAITGRRLTIDQVRILAGRATAEFTAIDPLMLRAIAEIESSRFTKAFRSEPRISDASAGLMQMLLGTARQVWDTGFHITAERPDRHEILFDPEISMRYAAAYLNMLRSWGGISRSEEFIVRAYNGGPGNANSGATVPYFAKYQAAKSRLTGG